MQTNGRKSARQNIDFFASIHLCDSEHEILVKDISVGGMKAVTRKDVPTFPFDHEVIVNIPFIADVKAVVCWKEDQTHGIRFVDCPPVLKQFVESILPVGDHISRVFNA